MAQSRSQNRGHNRDVKWYIFSALVCLRVYLTVFFGKSDPVAQGRLENSSAHHHALFEASRTETENDKGEALGVISQNVTLESTTESDSSGSVETPAADTPASQVPTEEEPAVLTIEDAIKALQKKQIATDKSQAEVYSAALVERLLKGGLREVAERKPDKAVVPRQLERCHPPQEVYTKTARARWARIIPSVYNWTLPAVQVTSEDGFSGLFHRWNFATKSDPVIQTAPASIFKGKWLRCAVVGPSANLMKTRYPPFSHSSQFLFAWPHSYEQQVTLRHTLSCRGASYVPYACYHYLPPHVHMYPRAILEWTKRLQQPLELSTCLPSIGC